MIAFLGMGLLGTNFVRAMIKKGSQVQVWNRTFEKAAALEQYGAIVCADITTAVKDAAIIHLTLRDDAVVDDILAKAGPALPNCRPRMYPSCPASAHHSSAPRASSSASSFPRRRP